MNTVPLDIDRYTLPTLATPNPSSWYVDETTTVRDKDSLPWMIAQGWKIVHELYDMSYGYDDEGKSYVTTYNYRWILSRRVLDSEKALATLVQDYAAAYNQGRTINNDRYDDIISVYTALLDTFTTETTSLDTRSADLDNLINLLIAAIEADYNAYYADVADDLNGYGQSARDKVATAFTAKESSAITALISKGLYNSTIIASLQLGLTREKTLAEHEVDDKVTLLQLEHKRKLYADKAAMRAKILEAITRRADFTTEYDRRIGLRNGIVQALANFMERRTDAYPDITAIGKAVAELGAGVVSGGNATTGGS